MHWVRRHLDDASSSNFCSNAQTDVFPVRLQCPIQDFGNLFSFFEILPFFHPRTLIGLKQSLGVVHQCIAECSIQSPSLSRNDTLIDVVSPGKVSAVGVLFLHQRPVYTYTFREPIQHSCKGPVWCCQCLLRSKAILIIIRIIEG